MHRWLVVLLLYAGCAFGITAPDPDRPRSELPKCDTGKGAVVLDGLVAGVSGMIAIAVLEEEPGVALVPAAIGALYLAGAIKGNSNANKCREAMSDYEAYVAGRETDSVDEERLRALRREATKDDPDEAPVRAATAHASRPGVPAVPAPAPAQAPPPAPVPVAAPAPGPVAAPVTPPAPAPVAGPAPAPSTKAPAKASPAKGAARDSDNDWSDFWREVE